MGGSGPERADPGRPSMIQMACNLFRLLSIRNSFFPAWREISCFESWPLRPSILMMVTVCDFLFLVPSSHYITLIPLLYVRFFSSLSSSLLMGSVNEMTVPGITGILMVVVLLILTISALELIRKRYYDVFWLAHRLFIVFVILLLIHPLRWVPNWHPALSQFSFLSCTRRLYMLTLFSNKRRRCLKR